MTTVPLVADRQRCPVIALPSWTVGRLMSTIADAAGLPDEQEVDGSMAYAASPRRLITSSPTRRETTIAT
jgi:hypothetical protein